MLDTYLGPGFTFAMFVLVSVWSLPWKGFALWKAARLGQPWWFVALLVVNTVGIFEIMYIFIFSEIGGSKKIEKKHHSK